LVHSAVHALSRAFARFAGSIDLGRKRPDCSFTTPRAADG